MTSRLAIPPPLLSRLCVLLVACGALTFSARSVAANDETAQESAANAHEESLRTNTPLPGGVALALDFTPLPIADRSALRGWFERFFTAAGGTIPADAGLDGEEAARAAARWLQTRPRDRFNDPTLEPELAAALLLARQSGSALLQQACLESFGSALGPLRSRREPPGDALRRALAEFTLAPPLRVFEGVDGRYLPALLEYLFDLRDFAAILRVSADVNPRIEPPSIARFRGVAEESPPGTLRVVLSAELDCELRVNGEPIEAQEVERVAGSHRVECYQGETRVFTDVVILPVGGEATLRLQPNASGGQENDEENASD